MWVIRFQIQAPFGHFRIPYTTIYKQTYPFPTKPAIIGIIGAILGWDEDTVLGKTKEFKIALPQWQNDGRFIEYAYILARKGKSSELRPERFEILVRPSFEIIIASENKELIELVFLGIQNRDFTFPIYMGKNEFVITEIISRCEKPYEEDISKVTQPSGIVFFPGVKIPSFSPTGSDLRPPQAFIGVPLELTKSKAKNIRRIRKICTALATKVPIKLTEPIDGFKTPCEVAII